MLHLILSGRMQSEWERQQKEEFPNTQFWNTGKSPYRTIYWHPTIMPLQNKGKYEYVSYLFQEDLTLTNTRNCYFVIKIKIKNEQAGVLWNSCQSLWWHVLTHWGRDKMDAISQTTVSWAFSSMEIAVFWLNFHWNMFARVQLAIIEHWFR